MLKFNQVDIAMRTVFLRRTSTCLFLLGLFSGDTLFSQVPFVSSINKTKARAQSTITIQGLNFGTSLPAVKVVIGGVAVTPDAISDQFIEAKVPFGATYESVRVLKTTTGLSGGSSTFFLPSFGGQNPFNETAISAQADFPAGAPVNEGLYEIAQADFDGDGFLDIVTSNNTINTMSVFRNTSTPGNVSFVKTQLNPGVRTIHVSAGDLNGDGKPDVLASESNGSRVFVYQNTSTPGSISFSQQTITLAGSKANQIRVEDLDQDGKPDLIVTDQVTGSARFFVVKNQSTTGAISLATPQIITLQSNTGTDGIYIQDLDGDHLPDIAMGEFLTANSRIFILRNTSAPGSISFHENDPINVSTTISNFCIGDLDGDQKPDVAITLLLSASVMVLKNQSTAGSISLAAPVLFDAGQRPWGIDFGDADGDGKIDIAVASITQKTITVLNNQSTPGTLAFTTKTIATGFINRMVKFGDVDGDARPDFVFTSIDDLNLGVAASKVSVIRNLNCITPEVTPLGPLTVCSTFNQRLTASASPGSTYEWFKSGVSMGAPSVTSFKDVTTSGSYTVQLVNGSCSRLSNAVVINVVVSAPLGAATIAPVAPVCKNGTLNLSVSNVMATQYLWTGPAGFSATGLNVSRTGFQATHAGKYLLDVVVGSCIAEQLSVIVDVVDIAGLSVQFEGADIICAGDTKGLSFLPTVTGFNYQWAEQTAGDIGGATSATVTVSTTGNYFIKLQSTLNPTCPVIASPARRIRRVNLPVVDFTFGGPNCTGQNVEFTNQSTTDPDASDPAVLYDWTFGDGNSSTAKDPSITYSSAQTYNVNLVVSYRDGACPAMLQKSLSIQSAPLISVTNPASNYIVCPGDSLKLEVLGTFSSYLWSNASTQPFIYAKDPGTYSVTVVAGCTLSASRPITQHPAPQVTAQASPQSTNVGSTIQLSATGLLNYAWSPTLGVDQPTQATTTAIAGGNTTYSVTGTDIHNCKGTASVAISVIAEDPLSLLKPKQYFSPNGDAFNPFWEVENMPALTECGVTIFDELGIKVFEAKPYMNDWDGISQKGQKLPAGVYFYIIRCEGSKQVLKGSIYLIR
jgi:gliding motility-associated-like protein